MIDWWRSFKQNDVVGFGKPNDLAGHLLRARMAKKYGLFGVTPMWGGVRIHEFYPPLSSILINALTLKISLLLTIIYTFSLFAYYRNPITGLIFISSYFFISPLIRCGRFPEIIGHLFVIHAFFVKDNLLSGILLGLAGLSHPLAFMFGVVILLLKSNLLLYFIAFLISGLWLVNFFLKRKQLGYLHQKWKGKPLSVYWISFGTMFNVLVFLFFPWQACLVFSVFCWLCPWMSEKTRIMQIFEGPLVFLDEMPRFFPKVKKIKNSLVLVFRKGHKEIVNSSQWGGMWAIATYLLERGIIVYNAYPETEIPTARIKWPKKKMPKIVID